MKNFFLIALMILALLLVTSTASAAQLIDFLEIGGSLKESYLTQLNASLLAAEGPAVGFVTDLLGNQRIEIDMPTKEFGSISGTSFYYAVTTKVNGKLQVQEFRAGKPAISDATMKITTTEDVLLEFLSGTDPFTALSDGVSSGKIKVESTNAITNVFLQISMVFFNLFSGLAKLFGM